MSVHPRHAVARLGRRAGDHPRRVALVAAVIALVLVAAVVTVARRNGPDGREGQGQVAGGAGTSSAAPATGGDGAGAGTDPTGTGTGPSGGPATGQQGGATTTVAPRPGATGASPPGASGAPGAEPVPPRTPVRCAPSGAPQGAPQPPADERDGRRWVTVGRLAGNCDAASTTFPLLGIDTRLVWRSDADSFAVFVVDAVQGRDATAGFADGQCAGACSERQPIVPPAGSYRLEVQAGDAPWEVEVQEYRRP